MNGIVGAPNGQRNHYISGNPKTTACGQFRPNGWPEANEGKPLCIKCEDGGKPHFEQQRPLPNTMGGTRKP
jgi:hypothetical protein